METLHLYSENFFLLPRLKYAAKKILGRSLRGPQAAEQSLTRGLTQAGQAFDLNRRPKYFGTIGVLSGISTLRRAILWKRRGMVKNIVAGPNLVVTPDDYNKIIQHPLINAVLQPSQWSADFYASLAPALKPKLRVWPAGVAVPAKFEGKKDLDFLIYNKLENSALFSGVATELTKQGYCWQALEYGKFKQEDYFVLLNRSRFLIYLSESESQGLAMFEAWVRGVPSLVWERGFWKYKNYSWRGRTASHYLDCQAGMVFKNSKEFKNILSKFVSSPFTPRKYVMENFTDEICAKKYLTIINELAA